jgi:Tol biopolymer transport system component
VLLNYRWSPDGSKIVFANPDGGLWTIAPDGTGLAEVFHQADAWAITPTWSPDGSMILFGLDPSPNPFAHPANGLYVIRADGTDVTLVLGGDDFKREPSWVAP